MKKRFNSDKWKRNLLRGVNNKINLLLKEDIYKNAFGGEYSPQEIIKRFKIDLKLFFLDGAITILKEKTRGAK